MAWGRFYNLNLGLDQFGKSKSPSNGLGVKALLSNQLCCWTQKTARMPVTGAQYPVGPDSTLYSTALIALEVTKKCTLKTIEEEHTQLAEPPCPPPIEVNRGKPAKTSYEPVLTVFVPPFFCLSLFSWFPLLLRRIQHSNNAQGFLYNHSWQALSCPFPLRLLPFPQPALCKMVLFLQK